MRYKLTIAYDGTAYCGWQVQPHRTTIQSLVQTALTTILRAPTYLTGAGRTDAGVHARGQTAHFDAPYLIDFSQIRLSLNALLPPDIRIFKIEVVEPAFHARYWATSKIYHYHLHLDSVIDPFTRLYKHCVFGPCDLGRIADAIPYFLGTRDFLSFTNESDRKQKLYNSVRTLFHLALIEQQGGARLEFEGDGFLYKMIRNIVGILLEIGAGKRAPQDLPQIFAAKNRIYAGATAPPHGLFLTEVRYGKQAYNCHST